jgi:hypothetical protein
MGYLNELTARLIIAWFYTLMGLPIVRLADSKDRSRTIAWYLFIVTNMPMASSAILLSKCLPHTERTKVTL